MNRRNWLKTLGKGIAGALGVAVAAKVAPEGPAYQRLNFFIRTPSAAAFTESQRRVMNLHREFEKLELAARTSGQGLQGTTAALEAFERNLESGGNG